MSEPTFDAYIRSLRVLLGDGRPVGDFTALSLTPLSQLDLDSLDLVEVLFVLQDINPTFEPPELSTEELATVTLGELHAQMLASLHRQSGE